MLAFLRGFLAAAVFGAGAALLVYALARVPALVEPPAPLLPVAPAPVCSVPKDVTVLCSETRVKHGVLRLTCVRRDRTGFELLHGPALESRISWLGEFYAPIR